MTANSAITVRGLRKTYDGRVALDGVDLDVRAGEIFGFLGRNGAGKTTTIEILEGYRERDCGEVAVLGVDPERPTRAWRERIGLVLQEGGLSPLLTVREALSMYAELYPSPRGVDSTLGLVGLANRAGTRVAALSGGQRRRLEVAVALVGDPDLVFLDEPTTGFDASARRDAWAMIAELRTLGTTVFLTTHYMEEAQHLADRVAILREGAIVTTGPPEALTADETRVLFRMPARVPLDEVACQVGCRVEVSDGRAMIRTPAPQRTLYRLTRWAEDSGIMLDALEVRRPSLEDVFLSVTGDD